MSIILSRMSATLRMTRRIAAAVSMATLVGCAAVEAPPLTVGHPASPQSAEGARPVLPDLSGDPTTRGTQERLASAVSGGGMKEMNHSKMPGMQHPMAVPEKPSPSGSDTAPAAVYTCPMHAEIKEAKPGDCPICGMKLIKKQTGKKAEHREEHQ